MTLLFPGLSGKTWADVSLDAFARADFPDGDNPLLDPQKCDAWVNELARKQSVDFTYGGYMEDRGHLWRGHYLPPGPQAHLGVDYNVPAGTKVSLIADGKIVHIARDGSYGGWGGLLVFKLDNPPLPGADYLYYGHLKWEDIVTKGQNLKAGDLVGHIGEPHQNGVWFPHLHVQLVSEKQMRKYANPELVDGYMAPPVPPEDFPDPRKIVRL